MESYKTGEAQVFVKIEDYKDTLELLGLIKEKVADAKKVLEDIHALKSDEDSELELWNSTLDEIEKRVENIDNALFEPERIG